MKLSTKIPSNICISFSGGVDSVVAYHFLKNGGRNIKLIHFHHSTSMANTFWQFCTMFAVTENVQLETHFIKGSSEEEWRNARYNILLQLSEKVVTAHHADDQIENMLIRKKEIPAERDNIIRPFLLTSKTEIYDYAKHHNLNWIEDPTNKHSFCKRNRIRNELLPLAKSIGVKI